jgi:hypothetical protein
MIENIYKCLTTVYALVFFLHLSTCCYIAIGNLEKGGDDVPISWIERFGLENASN